MRRLRAGLVCAVLCGCAVGPDYETPEVRAADAWHQDLVGGVHLGEADLTRWWTALDDPVLSSLIVRAARGNLDLKIAVARIKESRGILGIRKGERLPDINLFADATRMRPSADSPTTPPGGVNDTSVFSLGGDAFWEIDVFGRIRRGVEAAEGELEASIEDRRDVRVTLFAEVARNYVNLRSFQERLAITRANVTTQRSSLELTVARFDNGLSPALDVSQAEYNLAGTEASIPLLEQGVVISINRIAVLLGEQPGKLHPDLETEGLIPVAPEKVVVGIPANLLRQRPDIRAAERRLAAQTARIGVATADLYPRFALAGSIGWEASDVSDLLGSSSRVWSLGMPVQWNVFSGGRIRSRIDVEDARTEQALALYEQSILLALEEVENALTAYVQEQIRRDSLERAVASSKRAASLSRDQYIYGLADFQSVLDSERAQLDFEDQLTESRAQVTANLIQLYKALGGGWSQTKQPKKQKEKA